jgi:hypothetical protein
MLNDPNEDPRDERDDDDISEDDANVCGDVDREEVEDELVVEEAREESDWLPSW